MASTPKASFQALRVMTPVTRRLIEAATVAEEKRDLGYMHTVLCQTCMPYRAAPGVRLWKRRNGESFLELQAGRALNPTTGEFVDVPLPWGIKARLVLIHLTAEAIRRQSPIVPVEHSMTAFMRATLGFDPRGKDVRMMKQQFAALSTTTIRLAIRLSSTQAKQVDTKIVTSFDIWFPKDARQRVLWPSQIQFGADYWESLATHAVPLDMEHVRALSHGAMALDVYMWLAQRLHRIDLASPVSVSWEALAGQFGQGYENLKHFRPAFRTALRQVLTVYKNAYVAEMLDGKGGSVGLQLEHSPPPVRKTAIIVTKPVQN